MAVNQVKASFTCLNKQELENHTVFVFSASKAKEWTDYTPAGNMNISIANDKPAVKFFEQGKTYRLTFESEDAIMEARQKRHAEDEAWENQRASMFDAWQAKQENKYAGR